MRVSRNRRLALCAAAALTLVGVASRAVPLPHATFANAAAPAAELHSVSEVSLDPLTLEVTGSNLGAKGRVWIGGKRARVKSWADASVTCRVPGGLRGGVHAVEVAPRNTRVRPTPLPVVLPGSVGEKTRIELRLSARRRRYTSGSTYMDEARGLQRISYSREGVYWVHVRKRSEVCQRIFHWTPFPGWWSRRCRAVWRTVREKRGRRAYFNLRVSPESVEPGSLRVCSSADEYPTTVNGAGDRDWIVDSPMAFGASKEVKGGWMSTGRQGYADPDDGDWWIVIGCDQNGVVSGQFVGRSLRKARRRMRGSFVLHP